ncbi:MAG: FliM/FliN family flagellar motor switch protein [Polyangiaceae bacterium]
MPSHSDQVRPFPWSSLEALTRAEATAWNHLLLWIAARARLEDLERAFASLLGVRCEVIPRGVRCGDARDTATTGFGVLIEAAECDDGKVRILLDIEPALAAHAVALATQRDAGTVVLRAQPSARIAGAFAAVLATALRRVHTDKFLRVAGTGASPDLAEAMASGDASYTIARITVLLGDAAYDARVVAPEAVLAWAPNPPWSRDDLARLGPVPISVPIVAWSALWSAAHWVETRPDDALVLSDWPLRRVSGHWCGGPVWLASPFAELGVRARFDEAGALVLGRELDVLYASTDPMSEKEDNAIVTTVGDALVSLRVELANAVMPARDWAALAPGAIVRLGHRIGEPVILRVGGVPVARGDLIDIGGEVGVRIIERVSDPDCP